MYIGHYKSVSSPEEFYAKGRDTLDFPAQIELKGKRYLLNQTYQVSSESQYKNFINYAKSLNVEYDVEV